MCARNDLSDDGYENVFVPAVGVLSRYPPPARIVKSVVKAANDVSRRDFAQVPLFTEHSMD